jgi:hypothetical protein
VAAGCALHAKALPAEGTLKAVVALGMHKGIVRCHDRRWQHVYNASTSNPAMRVQREGLRFLLKREVSGYTCAPSNNIEQR